MKFKPALLRFQVDWTDPSTTHAEVKQTDCNGQTWAMTFWTNGVYYPPGHDRINDIIHCSSLHSCNKETLDVKCTFSVKNAKGVIIQQRERQSYIDPNNVNALVGAWDIKHRVFDPASNILTNDILNVEVTIQVKEKLDQLCDPEELKAHQNKGLRLLNNQEIADLSVDVDGKIFNVHSFILENYAPILADYCKQKDTNFGGVSSVRFQMILEYVYSGKRPDNLSILDFGKELIDAANRFELVELKLAIERILVRERILDKTNVADYIVFADSKTCPLLKEYAISYFLLHAKEILNSDYSASLRESGELLSEIMKIMAGQDEDETDMAVNELREELKELKLDIDGSKEVLLCRYEEAMRQMDERIE